MPYSDEDPEPVAKIDLTEDASHAKDGSSRHKKHGKHKKKKSSKKKKHKDVDYDDHRSTDENEGGSTPERPNASKKDEDDFVPGDVDVSSEIMKHKGYNVESVRNKLRKHKEEGSKKSPKHKEASRRRSRSPGHKSRKRRRSRSRDDDRDEVRRSRERSREKSRERSRDGSKERRSKVSKRSRDDHAKAKSSSQDVKYEQAEVISAAAAIKGEHSRKDFNEPSRGGAHSNNDASEVVVGSGAAEVSLSIEATNALRAKLGLKPLNMEKKNDKIDKSLKEKIASQEGGSVIEESRQRLEIHKPAVNEREKSLADKLRERLELRKQKREQESKLMLVPKLGDSKESKKSALSFVDELKTIRKEKAEASKRAKALEEMDDIFGVSDMVEEETRKEKDKQYTSKDLKGLTIEHDVSRFDTKDVVLTLKDADVLDEGDDTLVNVNIVDDEKADKRVEEIKKADKWYVNDDDDAFNFNLEGNKNMLTKYDESIDGENKAKFKLGQSGKYDEEKQRQLEQERIRAKLKNKTIESLSKVINVTTTDMGDYYTQEESEAMFKKKKKKDKKTKKLRGQSKGKSKSKVLTADDLMDDQVTEQFGNRKKAKASTSASSVEEKRATIPMDIDEDDEDQNLPIATSIKVEEDNEDDDELEQALIRARQLRQRNAAITASVTIKKEEQDDEETMEGGNDVLKDASSLVMNETAEFCRNLSSQQQSASNFYREAQLQKHASSTIDVEKDEDEGVDQQLLEFEKGLKNNRGKWEQIDEASNDVNMGDDEEEELVIRPSSSRTEDSRHRDAILDEEPDLHSGMAAALQLASSKGYLKTDEKRGTTAALQHLMAKNYTIEDKAREQDGDRSFSRRGDRGSNGPLTSFKELPLKFDPKLEYTDDNGRKLSQKEAFRYLSHRFHGKGSGKMKTEKRMKKISEEQAMLKMNSTDTPLGTLDRLISKQKESQSHYLVLGGNKGPNGDPLKDLRK